MNWNPAHSVFEQSRRTPDRLALFADGVELTYAELVSRAGRLAQALREKGIGRGSKVGILGSRSLVAVEGVLGVCWAGATYVPLGVKWPEDRLKSALAALDGVDALIVDETGIEALTPALLAATKHVLVPGDDAARAHTTPASDRASIRVR